MKYCYLIILSVKNQKKILKDTVVTMSPGCSIWLLLIAEGHSWNSTNEAEFLPPFEKAVRRLNSFIFCGGEGEAVEFPTKCGSYQELLEKQTHRLQKFMLDAQKHSFWFWWVLFLSFKFILGYFQNCIQNGTKLVIINHIQRSFGQYSW